MPALEGRPLLAPQALQDLDGVVERLQSVTGWSDDDLRQLPIWEGDTFEPGETYFNLNLPEIDGCFVDSHELGRAYGTAMALLCFAALSP